MGRASAAATERRGEIRAHVGLRGLAALFVVAYHLQFGVHHYLWFERASPLFRRSYLFVDLFFVLSGFILSYVNDAERTPSLTRQGYARFLLRRFCRLYPLLIFSLAAMLFTRGLYSLALHLLGHPPTPDWSGWNLTVLGLQAAMLNAAVPGAVAWNIPSWSISAELFAYLVFPVAALLLARRRRAAVLLFAAGPLAYYAAILGTTGSLDIVAGWAPLRCLAGFGLGMLLYAQRRPVAAAPTWLLGLVQGAALVLVVAALAHDGRDPLVMPAFAALVIATASDAGPLSRLLGLPVFHWLGTISYSIYLDHIVVLETLGRVTGSRPVRQLLGDGDPYRAMTIASGYAATILAAALTYRFVEVPGREWLSRRLLDRRPVPIEASPPAP